MGAFIVGVVVGAAVQRFFGAQIEAKIRGLLSRSD